MSDVLEQVQAVADAAPKVDLHSIELAFYSTRKKTALSVKKESDAPAPHVKLTNKGYTHDFQQPMFVEKIEVFCPDSEGHGPKVRVEVKKASDGAVLRLDSSEIDDEKCLAAVPVGLLISGFAIVSARGRFEFNDKISGVKVTGLLPEDFEAIESAAIKFEELRGEVTSLLETEKGRLQRELKDLSSAKTAHEKALQADKTALDNERAEHLKQVEKLKADAKTAQDGLEVAEKKLAAKNVDLASVTEKVSGLEETKAQRESLINELNSKHDGLVNRIRERDAEIDLKSQKVAKLNEDLLQLNSDKSLFTDDMIGFTRQGAEQVKAYLWVLVPALLVGGALAGLSVYGAIDLFKTFVGTQSMHDKAKDLILLKSPFVLLASAIYTFLYKFSKPFISRIIEIHSRRMRLSEITILASKFSDSALEGVELDEKEKLAAKMAVRTQLVREYLSGSFDPKTPQNLRSGVSQLTDDKPGTPLDGILSGIQSGVQKVLPQGKTKAPDAEAERAGNA